MNAINTLSPREYEVAELWSFGLEAHQIADKLFIAYDTVRCHKKNIAKKLRTTNAVQVCVQMMRHDPQKFLNGLGLVLAIITLLNQ